MHAEVLVDILQVEDDPDLTDILRQSLEHLGFGGNLVHAASVEDAYRIIDKIERLDIVFSDMNLADGTGLDVIRQVRAHSRWGETPIIIMSGDTRPRVLGSAYALGANSYVLKAPRGRSQLDVVRGIYDHWLRDVVLPPPKESGPGETLTQLAKLRERHSKLYLELAQRFPLESDFWLARALNQTNRSNLLRFVRSQLEPQRTFPIDLLAAVDHSIREHEHRLAVIERAFQKRPPTTREAAGELMLELVELGDHEAHVRAVGWMCPVSPAAVAALLDSWATNLEIVATWIDANTSSDVLHARAASCRDLAAVIRRQEQQVRQGNAVVASPS